MLSDGVFFYGVNTSPYEVYVCANVAGVSGMTASNWTQNAYKIFDIYERGGTNNRYFEDGVELTGSPYTGKKPNTTTQKAFFSCPENASLFCDWVLIRNYTLNEPTWASSGAEEALGSIIRSVPRNARILVMSH